MWKFIIKGFGQGRESQNCSDLAPYLTKLFDGEASEEEAARARAHLLSCRQCARTWTSWTQTRQMLQQTHVPLPPPNMLWRVVMACRLAAFGVDGGQQEQQKATHPAVREEELYAHSAADMKARLLAMTVGSSPAPRPPRHRLAAYSWLGTPAAAMPALAVLLMTSQWSMAPTIRVADNTPQARSSATEQPVVQRARMPRAEFRPAPISLKPQRSLVGLPSPVAEARTSSLPPQNIAVEPRGAAQEVESETPPRREVEVAPNTLRGQAAAPVRLASFVPDNPAEPRVQAVPPRTMPVRARMTVEEGDISPSRTRFRPLRDTAPAAAFMRTALRVSLPVSPAAVAVEPVSTSRPSAVRVALAPRDSVEGEEVDAGFAEVRSVVNDYRALFAETSVEEGG